MTVDADAVGLGGHPVHGEQRLARKPPSAERRREQRCRTREQKEDEHPLHGVLDVLEALCRDQHLRPGDAQSLGCRLDHRRAARESSTSC